MNIKHNKEDVLKLGQTLFCTKGYNNLGVDEICKTTGMTKGAFYNAFNSKEHFLFETITLYGENNVQRIKNELEDSIKFSAYERLQNFYIKMLEYQPKSNYMGCYINNLMSELGASNTKVAAMTNTEFNNFIEAIEPTVLEAQINGELTLKINSKEITELIHSTFYGILTRVKSSQDINQSITIMNLLFNNLKKQ